jgi:hypothetical protein
VSCGGCHNLSQEDAPIVMVLVGDITTGYAQDVAVVANVQSVMAQADTIKSNTDKEIKEYKNKEEI